MTQWEQMKKEYREIPIPEDGQYQMLQAIAKAKQKRDSVQSNLKRAAKYVSIAAAAFVVVLCLPMLLLFSRGFGSSAPECAPPMMQDCVTESAVSEDRFLEAGMTAAKGDAGTDMNYSTNLDAEADMAMPEEENLWNREGISKEIIRQMKERMLADDELYYVKSEEYPDGFELLAENQEYYINEEGLLVIVFEAGAVAPKEQGVVEFVIPAEVVIP